MEWFELLNWIIESGDKILRAIGEVRKLNRKTAGRPNNSNSEQTERVLLETAENLRSLVNEVRRDYKEAKEARWGKHGADKLDG